MNHSMFPLGRDVTEGFVTILTLVRFLSSVCPYVLLQVARHAERLATPVEGALERSRSSVYPTVSLQICQVSEPPAAHRTLIRPLSGVGSDVGPQMV